MSSIELKCKICLKSFKRRKAEHNRSIKKGRKIYCSLRCSGKGNARNLGKALGNGNTENLIANNRKDEYSTFKWYMRVINKRKKDCDVDLPYLKQIWEDQKGICPLTNWKLELPKHSTNWGSKENKIYRASIDRIDSNKGYIKGNIRYISVMANYCKNIFTDEEVVVFCEAVTSNFRPPSAST